MDEQTRKAWSRPELIVIVRGNLEEAVLTACKNGSDVTNSSLGGNQACHRGFMCTVTCDAISAS
jgi:hypothetical protein